MESWSWTHDIVWFWRNIHFLAKDRYMKPLKLKGDGKIEVTIHYVSDETLVQEDEVGNSYVFKKMSDSYPIPYVLWLESYCWKTGFYLLSFAKYGPRQSNHVNVVGVVSVQQ